MVICLERGADLHMAQLMPLPLTVSCFSKIQIGFTFLVPANPGSPGQRAVERVCVVVEVHTHNRLMALCPGLLVWDGTRRNIHPAHTHPDHQTSLSTSVYLLRSIASSLLNLLACKSLTDSLSLGPLWSTCWSGTLYCILHTILHSVIIFFLQHMPIPSQPVRLQYWDYVVCS